MPVLLEWDNKSAVKRRLAARLKAAKEHRKKLVEESWRQAERVAYGGYDDLTQIQTQLRELVGDTEDFDLGESIEVNYAFKNLRLLHAQLSSNPPVATPRPESSDLEDRRAADSANQCMIWFLRSYQLQEKVDLVSLDTLVYGTGIMRTGFNPNAGEILDFDEETGEITMTGDIEVHRISPWVFWIDPAATVWADGQGDVRYAFEELTLSSDEVKSQFPDQWGLFKKHKQTPSHISTMQPTGSDKSVLTVESPEQQQDKHVFYAYFEPGTPENAMMGRFVYCFEDGTTITPPTANPNQHRPSPSLKQRQRYRATGRKPKRKPGRAYLPYHILTDIDVPNQIWGRSSLHYAGPAQNLMRSLDSATLDAVKAHGVARLVMPAGAEVQEDSVTNSSVEYIKMEKDADGGGMPQFIPPPGMPAAMTELRANMRAGIDDTMGVNESMFGQQSREQSGFSMQYAVNQGSMIRRRLFNKYVLFIESMYRALLRLAIQHWDDPKMIKVLGKENAFSIVEMRGIDIDGGYEIVTEYGTTLPLDPMSRRDELMKLVPIYKEAGMDTKVLIEALNLNDIKSTQDILTLSRKRMEELIDAMVAFNIQIPPRKYQDHAGMLAYCREYIMTSQYFSLPEPAKQLIEDHMTARAQMAASEEQGPASLAANPSGGPAPGPAGAAAAPGGLPIAPGTPNAAASPPIPGAPPGGPSPGGMTPPPATPPSLGSGPSAA